MRRPARPPANAATLAAALAAAAALVAAPGGAAAEGRLPCTGFGQLAGFLKDTYGESPVSTGLQSNGQVLQIFSSADTGSWTAVTTSPTGLACVVATGRHWEQAGDQGGGGAGRVFNPAAHR